MKIPKPLHYKQLRVTLNPKSLSFKNTRVAKISTEIIGQARVIEAMNFGITIRSRGYNMYAMGPAGVGKRTIIRNLLKKFAIKQPPPPDWCYIYNFVSAENPIAIPLPAGLGRIFQNDMRLLISDLRISILTVFESDEYRQDIQQIKNTFAKKRKHMYKQVKEYINNNKIPHLYRERHEREKELQLKYTLYVIKPYFLKLKQKYSKFPKIIKYLTDVQNDIVANVNELVKLDETSELIIFDLENPILTRYEVNLLVNNHKKKGVPVIFVERPNYSNLVCRIEYKSQFGNMVTDFTLIRSGALHRANGGFLIIEARKIIKDKEAWESLKSALYSHKIKIESIENLSESTQPISLKPKSIPLNIKIILLGTRNTYYELCKKDLDFSELFKVAIDFDEQVTRSKKNIQLYAQLIATFIRKKNLLHFTADAIAAIIDHSSRLAEDIQKLSIHILRIYDLVQEADYFARFEHKKLVDKHDVHKAINFQIHRMDRSRELYYEDINRNFILIKTAGLQIGQINCLSVVRVGKFSYGHPTRITAKARCGKGHIIDIQREIKLAGPIHSKASLTLANFLADRYSKKNLFSLHASISFEQIYGMLEGDSASIAETCALLSVLAHVPLRQSIAITGSINQYGEAQAIGGVNEKIEGFFDICKARGLTGQQGVIIPAINIKNLMLRTDIIESVKSKKFFIYPINHLDEAIALLTGLPAGQYSKNGKYPMNSINYKVEEKLKLFARLRFKPKTR